MNTFYFAHDCNTQRNAKIKLLLKQHGAAGYGIFWSLVEDLYVNNNLLDADYETLAFDYRVDVEIIRSVINDFKLFVIKDGKFFSKSVARRLKERNKKVATARKAAQKRWTADADALPTHSEPIAIKEKKIKNSIEKENRGRVEETESRKTEREETVLNAPLADNLFANRADVFKQEINTYSHTYNPTMLNDFFRYWSEPNYAKTKMKKDLEATWDTASRLAVWEQREHKYHKAPEPPKQPVYDYVAERKALEERTRQFARELRS